MVLSTTVRDAPPASCGQSVRFSVNGRTLALVGGMKVMHEDYMITPRPRWCAALCSTYDTRVIEPVAPAFGWLCMDTYANLVVRPAAWCRRDRRHEDNGQRTRRCRPSNKPAAARWAGDLCPQVFGLDCSCSPHRDSHTHVIRKTWVEGVTRLFLDESLSSEGEWHAKHTTKGRLQVRQVVTYHVLSRAWRDMARLTRTARSRFSGFPRCRPHTATGSSRGGSAAYGAPGSSPCRP